MQHLAAKEADPQIAALLRQTAAQLQREAARRQRGKGPAPRLTVKALLALADAKACPVLGDELLRSGPFLSWVGRFRQLPTVRYQAVVNSYTYLSALQVPAAVVAPLTQCLTISVQHDVWQPYKALTQKLKTLENCPKYTSQLLYLEALRGRPTEPVDFRGDLAKRRSGRGPTRQAVEAALGQSLVDWVEARLRAALAEPIPPVADSWRRRYSLVASGSGRAAHDPEFRELPLRATEPKNWAAAKLDKWDDLVSRLEPQCLVRPVKKQNELNKLRAIYPVPLYTSILEAVVWGDVEKRLKDPELVMTHPDAQLHRDEDEIQSWCRSGLLISSFDYEDFNNQHSLDSLEAVVQALYRLRLQAHPEDQPLLDLAL